MISKAQGKMSGLLNFPPLIRGDTNPQTQAAQDNGQNPEEQNLRQASEKGVIITILQKRKLRLREESEPERKGEGFKAKSLSSAPQASLSLLLC